MRLVLFILFFGYPITKEENVPEERIFHPPHIHMSPSWIVSLGGNVTISCWVHLDCWLDFFLHKDGVKINTTSGGYKRKALFHISDVTRKDGGTYSCHYRMPLKTYRSEHSNSVELFVLDPSLPKPTISPIGMSAIEKNATIQCQSQSPIAGFYLQKDEDQMDHKHMETNGTRGSYTISNISQADGGGYRCRYSSESEPFVISEPSDPVELLLEDPKLPIPVISIYPSSFVSLGHSVTIQCKTEERSAKFFLHKAGDPKPRFLTSPKSNEGELSLNISWEDKGSYRCSYIPQSNLFLHSCHSSPLQLPATDHRLPKPSITLSHDEEVTLGSNVTIDCRSNATAVRFYFQKYGVAKPVQLIQNNGTVAKFSISNASWEHSGYYSCTYSTLPDCFAISEPSDEVELQLTDPDLARPTISLSPRGPLPLGGNVTLNCQGQGVRFKFYRHRENFVPQLLKNNLDGAHLIISNLSRDDAVGYSCKCNSISEVFSVSSEIVKLLILDSPLFAPVISIQHEGCVALGGQVEIKCESDSEDVNFSLHKTGDTNPTLMNGHFYVGEFIISSFTREHEGNYSCIYESTEEPFMISAPSDSLEILISDTYNCTQVNIIRFAIGVLILLLLTCIILSNQHFRGNMINIS
ncbi:immunoglobulin superfamily member 1-like isoform X1 [Podarcis raffonei]|uniref:immunoglobulin superfamily member 1-like isoform X1 n=2 Tax=Podarcis raffonei TaxID=65483 RepID=UPI0023291219|nr:immunoglobulin superfamily member 1-like isoform X1 [Podarcis raffonei]